MNRDEWMLRLLGDVYAWRKSVWRILVLQAMAESWLKEDDERRRALDELSKEV